jgi:hypothetical protein
MRSRRRGDRRAGVGGGDGVVASGPSLEFDGAAVADGADELPDRPAGAGFDPAADREGGEYDGQVPTPGARSPAPHGERSTRSAPSWRLTISSPSARTAPGNSTHAWLS